MGKKRESYFSFSNLVWLPSRLSTKCTLYIFYIILIIISEIICRSVGLYSRNRFFFWIENFDAGVFHHVGGFFS